MICHGEKYSKARFRRMQGQGFAILEEVVMECLKGTLEQRHRDSKKMKDLAMQLSVRRVFQIKG